MKSGAILKSRAVLAATILGSLSLPLLAQQPASPSSTPAPPSTQVPATQAPASQAPASQAPASQAPGAAQAPPTQSPTTHAPTALVADLRPVQVELEQKLDSKTAKNGDSVVAQTRSAIKTADGTEIPKGSKLTGHILAVQPSNGANAQVALKFDQIEIKGGQSLAVQSQIQSITPAGASETASAQESPMSTPQSPAASAPRTGTAMQPATPSASGAAASPSSAGSPASAASGPPAAGTVVAQNGGINIVTTAVPGVLLANNAPGQQDPRMARVSSILLGARRDIQLESGTHMVVAIASAGQ